MSDQSKPARVSRRTVLIAAAGAAPLLALAATGAQAAKLAQSAVKYQELAQGRETVRRLQTLRRAQFLQVCRRRHLVEGLVRAMGKKRLMAALSE